MDLINTEEYPQADRQYKDRLFRFIFQRPALECETVMLNINYGHNRALMEKCRRLKEYAIFVATVRENLERPLPLREAVAEAVDTCTRRGMKTATRMAERTAGQTCSGSKSRRSWQRANL